MYIKTHSGCDLHVGCILGVKAYTKAHANEQQLSDRNSVSIL
jgi:hypothetical protein